MSSRFLVFFAGTLVLNGLVPGVGLAQLENRCREAQQLLSGRIRSNPPAAVALLGRAIQASEDCAPQLLAGAIEASNADNDLVGRLLAEAISRVPGQVVAIADSAIAAAPTASDVIAGVVRQMMGDCDALAEELRRRLAEAPEKAMLTLEDSLRAHENCACTIVRVMVKWASDDPKAIQRIVATAVRMAPAQAASITECASAEVPHAVEAIHAGLEEILVDLERGPGALTAGAEADAAAAKADAEESDSPGYGKNARVAQEDEEELSKWYSWVLPPNHGFYFISPSSVRVTDRRLDEETPMSPTNPSLHEPAPNE